LPPINLRDASLNIEASNDLSLGQKILKSTTIARGKNMLD